MLRNINEVSDNKTVCADNIWNMGFVVQQRYMVIRLKGKSNHEVCSQLYDINSYSKTTQSLKMYHYVLRVHESECLSE